MRPTNLSVGTVAIRAIHPARYLPGLKEAWDVRVLTDAFNGMKAVAVDGDLLANVVVANHSVHDGLTHRIAFGVTLVAYLLLVESPLHWNTPTRKPADSLHGPPDERGS